MNKNFKIGDSVRVTDSGKQYSTYDEMALLMKLQNWSSRDGVCHGDIGEVVAIRNHTTWKGTICVGIRVKSTGRDHIISSDGLELFAPKLWAIEVTVENKDIVNAWWLNKVKDSPNQCWIKNHPYGLPIGYTVLSEHWSDTSYYSCWSSYKVVSKKVEYTPITLEQFIQITKQENNTNMKTPNPDKEIKIGRDLLNQYYDAATSEQRNYINDNFKVDGTTTVQGIVGLHDIACSTWKPKIKQNHPECFVEESKEFDFSKMNHKKLFSNDVIEALGIKCVHTQFMEIRGGGDYENKAFYLTDEFNWELKKDSTGEWVLIPTRK